MNHRLRLTAIASTVVAFAAIAGGYAAAQTASGGPTQLQPPYVARDTSGDPVLSVRLQQGVRGTGQFYFTVADIGVWVGVIGVEPAGHSAVVHLRGEVDAMFTANNSNRPVSVSVRMEGTVNTAHNSAVINLWATRPGHPGQTHYLINTNPPPQTHKAARAALTAAQALQAQDWDALYTMAASQITTTYTKAQFIELLSAQHQPHVSNITPVAQGTISENAGLTYYTQTFEFTTVQNGKTSHYTAEVVLVWEAKAWRFAGTTPPAS